MKRGSPKLDSPDPMTRRGISASSSVATDNNNNNIIMIIGSIVKILLLKQKYFGIQKMNTRKSTNNCRPLTTKKPFTRRPRLHGSTPGSGGTATRRRFSTMTRTWKKRKGSLQRPSFLRLPATGTGAGFVLRLVVETVGPHPYAQGIPIRIGADMEFDGVDTVAIVSLPVRVSIGSFSKLGYRCF